MSDSEKDRPENPKAGDPEAKHSGGAVVISIEQARQELLSRPRRGSSQGGASRSRSRAREVPAPVTLPPGEHNAVIVADTPAARAHVDKKTVHPGEMPAQIHDKKVRVKTSLDPRRAKTEISDRRAELPPEPSDGEVGSLWSPAAVAPAPVPASIPPPAASPSVPPRISVARGKPIPREGSGVPLFIVGVILAAALGAGVVYLLGRTGSPGPAASTASAPQPQPQIAAPPAVTTGAPPAVATTPIATAPEPPTTAPEPPAASGAPPAVAGGPSPVKGAAPSAKPTATAAPEPTATSKPTATNILPFGKEEP